MKKKTTLDLGKIRNIEVEKIQKALANKPKGEEVKKGVDLSALAQNLAKRHMEKLKSASEE
jgi:hypothetical protein